MCTGYVEKLLKPYNVCIELVGLSAYETRILFPFHCIVFITIWQRISSLYRFNKMLMCSNL